jgi:hypothetical protein
MSPKQVECIGCGRVIDGKKRPQSEDPLRCVVCYFQGDQKLDWGRGQ